MYQDYKELLVKKQDKIVVIKFNKPEKKNCINIKCYSEITKVLKEAGQDDSITMLVFTGVGDFYTAGNDMSGSAHIEDMDAYIIKSNAIFKNMIHEFIECPKAYFSTPFVKLGIVPEGGSSYIFPLLMGRSKSTEVLLFGEILSAQEAYNFNFVSRIYKKYELDSVIWNKLREFSQLPPGSLKISKRLVRSEEKKTLLQVVDKECEELAKRLRSEEFMNAIIQFAMRKSKL